MTRLLLLTALLVTLNACQAAHNTQHAAASPPVSVLVLPPPTVPEEPASKGQPYRFATAVDVAVTPGNYGDWAVGERAHWRLDLLSSNATSLGLMFDTLWLPQGAMLRIYAVDQPDQVKVYTGTSGEAARVFTPTFPGDRLALELSVPVDQRSSVQLRISQVFVGFR